MPAYPLDHPLHPGASGKRVLKPEPGADLVSWTRVSTIAKTVPSDYGLQDWRQRMLVKGIGTRPDLYALAAATPLDHKNALDEIVQQALEAAGVHISRNLGTALHGFTEMVDSGEDVTIPQPWAKDVEAYKKKLEELEIELIEGMQELRIINPRWADGGAAGVGGRFDRIVMYKGRPTIADVKSGSDPLLYGSGSIAIQLWMYATAWAIWDGEAFLSLPKGMNTEYGLVIHLPAGQARAEITEVHFDGVEEEVQLAMAVRYSRSKFKPKLVAVGDADEDDEPADELAEKRATKKAPAKKAVPAKKAAPVEPEPEPAKVKKTNGVVMDGTGKKALAPLASPGQMGCSKCGRTGHRRTSAKCLGDNDPVFSSSDEPDEPDEAEHVETEHVQPSEPAEDPFEDEDEDEDDEDDEEVIDWADRIKQTTNKKEISAIRKEAKEAGAWTAELLAIALEQLDSIE
jgi:hypothetical protein